MPTELIGLIQFVVLVFGITYYVTASWIFAPIRIFAHSINLTIGYLLYCPVCTATWVGAILGICGFYPFTALIHPFVDAAIFGTATAVMLPLNDIPLDHPSNR